MRMIMIGNSHSLDTFWLLKKVFADQMPEQEVELGVLFYRGCTISQHVKFTQENQNVYGYYSNKDGSWNVEKGVGMDAGLCDGNWDIVAFQSGRGDRPNAFNLEGRRILERIVKDRVAEPYKMIWHSTWPSPSDPIFFAEDYPIRPPAKLVEFLQREYNHDMFLQYKSMTESATSYLLEDQTYEKVISTGGGVMYAHANLEVPQSAIWRDYVHLTDYGRLIAAYTFYAQFTGNAISEINIDVIPADLRQKRFCAEGDLIVTEEMKQVIIAAANHALKDPWTAPKRPAANEAEK